MTGGLPVDGGRPPSEAPGQPPVTAGGGLGVGSGDAAPWLVGQAEERQLEGGDVGEAEQLQWLGRYFEGVAVDPLAPARRLRAADGSLLTRRRWMREMQVGGRAQVGYSARESACLWFK
jgi:hypothetical protein